MAEGRYKETSFSTVSLLAHTEGTSVFAEVKEREHLSLFFTHSWRDLIPGHTTNSGNLLLYCPALLKARCMCSIQVVEHETEEEKKPFLFYKRAILIFDNS